MIALRGFERRTARAAVEGRDRALQFVGRANQRFRIVGVGVGARARIGARRDVAERLQPLPRVAAQASSARPPSRAPRRRWSGRAAAPRASAREPHRGRRDSWFRADRRADRRARGSADRSACNRAWRWRSAAPSVRVRLASIASRYAERSAAPDFRRTDLPSNSAGAATPTRSSAVGARSISCTSPSQLPPRSPRLIPDPNP